MKDFYNNVGIIPNNYMAENAESNLKVKPQKKYTENNE